MKGRVWAIGTKTALKAIHDFVQESERVDEDIVVFHRLVMQVVHAGAEIQGPVKTGSYAQFLRELLGSLLRKIFAHKMIRAAELRIAELSVFADEFRNEGAMSRVVEQVGRRQELWL